MSFLSIPISLFPIKPVRQIGSIKVDVIISEATTDRLTITKQPVQQGANIGDHAYMEPTDLSMKIIQASDLSTSLSTIYQEFLTLQSSMVPFSVVTPKRTYNQMLIAALNVTTDKRTEAVISINLTLQQIIIVSVVTTQVSRSQQRNVGNTGATQRGGNVSALATLKTGIGALFK